MKVDIVLDLETLGTVPGAVVLGIGAVVVQDFGAWFSVNLLEDDQPMAHVEAETVTWWERPCMDAAWMQGRRKPVASAQAVRMLEEWMRLVAENAGVSIKDVYLWGNGPSFDLAMLAVLCQRVGVKQWWNFRRERCVRTALGEALWPDTLPHQYIPHVALHDAMREGLALRRYVEGLPVPFFKPPPMALGMGYRR